MARGRDLSGWWLGVPLPQIRLMQGQLPPMKPAAGDQLKAATRGVLTGAANDYCRPPKFSGFNWGIAAELELLTSPGRITIIADDIGLVRRIYLGARLPPAPEPTNAGTSVGRWEGDALVVETAGLDPSAPFPVNFPGSPAIGPGARVVERFSLVDPDTLAIDAEITAPEVLTQPYHQRYVYRRVRKDFDYSTPYCVDFDRSSDPKTGRQRFDMTPPPDLPPPPPN